MPSTTPDATNPGDKLPRGLFADVAGAGKNLEKLRQAHVGSGSTVPLADMDSALTDLLVASPDPDMMLTNFLRFVEASVSKAALLNDLVRFPPLADLASRIFGHSQYFSDILIRDPELFRWLTATGVLEGSAVPSSFAPEIDRIRRTFATTERRLNAIRRLYRREVLRIGARDILGKEDLSATTKELSDLADAIIGAADVSAGEELQEKYGIVVATPFCIIGLGKLGGEELNYSSDIDVMFVYGDEGTFEDRHGREHTFHEYFIKRAERIVQTLTERTGEGHLYRVDTRLRPEGAAGPLARSIQSYLSYYESRGDLWERQMLIKARVVAGDPGLGEDFIRQISPFVYPRTHFSHPGESVARIKSRIEAELSSDDNIKLRPGGIRDIEFTVQILQLVHGGKDVDVRHVNTLESIKRLNLKGHFTKEQQRDLSAAYILFRTLEHRLQIVLNTQTHRIPADNRQLNALAKRLGLDDGETMMDLLRRHFERVREIFEGVLSVGDSKPSYDVDVLLDTHAEEPGALLSQYGISDWRKAVRNLRSLLMGSGITQAKRLDARSTDAFRSVAGALLGGIRESPVPDMTLNNLTLLSGGQSFPEQFYHQLQDSRFRALVLRVCGISPLLARGLMRYPTLLDELASGIRTSVTEPGKRSTIAFKNQEEIRIGVLNVLKVLSFEEMTAGLTALADRIITSAAEEDISKPANRTPLAIFALGKYGTGELSFGGDLDLLFLTRVPKQTALAKVETQVQRFFKRMTEISHDGVLYEVDARLRPEGKNAPLVTDFSAYVKYLSSRASLWERQSLTRLRFVWGDGDLAAEVNDAVAKFVYESPLPDDWAQSIVMMRKAMETRSRTSRGGSYLDVKLGPGGMVDVEFLAQMTQLLVGRKDANLRRRRPTGEVLEMTPAEVLSGDAARGLIGTYQFYREVEKLMRLTLEEKNTILPDDEKLETLARCQSGMGGDEMKERIAVSMREVRQQFLAVSERMSRAES